MDTTSKTMFVFPGQGVQTIGMGADLAQHFRIAKDVFEEVDEALHQKLSDMMFKGNLSELTQTQNAQPAIMAVSMAVFRVLKSLGAKMPDAVAGHSLGEYSALCAAEVLTLSDTAKLLQARGLAMAKACEQSHGGMLALLGATPEQAQEIAAQTNCYVANDNAPGQIVLSGLVDPLICAQEMAKKMEIKRAIPLQVAGAFHSPLMQSAADEMKSVLEETSFKAPVIPVYFDVLADVNVQPNQYATLLTRQIVEPVRWRELIQNAQMPHFVECGPGMTLAGLIRRICPAAMVTSVVTPQEIESFIQQGVVA